MAEEGSPEVDEASDAASENENDPEKTNVKDEENSTMAEQKLGAEDRESSSQEAAPVKKYDPKDPLRPRRKKARRACFACQRAHLTCGMLDLFFLSVLLYIEVPLQLPERYPLQPG